MALRISCSRSPAISALFRTGFHAAALAAAGTALFMTATGAYALETPRRSGEDHRIQYVDYSKDDVVRVNAANGYITTIVFAPGEKVVSYGSGYSTAWEFATADNQFFLKPKDRDGTTNLVIVTDQRIYNLDVYLVEKAANATYKLTYRYPEEYIKARIEAGQQEYVEKELEKADPALTGAVAGLNRAYTMNFGRTEGSRRLAPLSCYDNGRFTYMRFRSNTDFPAVYSVSADGEAIVNSHIEDGALVVHGVYPEFRLRAGSDVVGIYNEGYGKPVRGTEDSGTTVEGLSRDFREQQ